MSLSLSDGKARRRVSPATVITIESYDDGTAAASAQFGVVDTAVRLVAGRETVNPSKKRTSGSDEISLAFATSVSPNSGQIAWNGDAAQIASKVADGYARGGSKYVWASSGFSRMARRQ